MTVEREFSNVHKKINNSLIKLAKELELSIKYYKTFILIEKKQVRTVRYSLSIKKGLTGKEKLS